MSDDLVKRLNMANMTTHPMTLVIIAREAAACIEQQNKRNKELEEALRTIVCNTEPEAWRHATYEQLTGSIFDCARAALEEKKDG